MPEKKKKKLFARRPGVYSVSKILTRATRALGVRHSPSPPKRKKPPKARNVRRSKHKTEETQRTSKPPSPSPITTCKSSGTPTPAKVAEPVTMMEVSPPEALKTSVEATPPKTLKSSVEATPPKTLKSSVEATPPKTLKSSVETSPPKTFKSTAESEYIHITKSTIFPLVIPEKVSQRAKSDERECRKGGKPSPKKTPKEEQSTLVVSGKVAKPDRHTEVTEQKQSLNVGTEVTEADQDTEVTQAEPNTEVTEAEPDMEATEPETWMDVLKKSAQGTDRDEEAIAVEDGGLEIDFAEASVVDFIPPPQSSSLATTQSDATNTVSENCSDDAVSIQSSDITTAQNISSGDRSPQPEPETLSTQLSDKEKKSSKSSKKDSKSENLKSS